MLLKSIVSGNMKPPGLTADAQEAFELHMEVQLCREMHWTRQQLYDQDEDWVWAVVTILGEESKVMKDKGRPSPQGPATPPQLTRHPL